VTKGREGEREVADLLREAAGFDAFVSAPMQAGVRRRFGDVGGVPGLRIFVRREKRVDVRRAIRDAIDGAEGLQSILDRELPVVFHRDDRGGWRVTVEAVAFARLVKRAGRAP
jgi:hypothetical protein